MPPKAFTDIIDAYIKQQTCGRRRTIYDLGDLFCVASSPVQAKEAWLKAKKISTPPVTSDQIRKLLKANAYQRRE